MSDALNRHDVLALPLGEVIGFMTRCADFAALVQLARASGGKYNRVERMLKESHELTDELARLKALAARAAVSAEKEN